MNRFFQMSTSPLEEVRKKMLNAMPKIDAIGITINLPRTKQFVKLTSNEQKVVLKYILNASLRQIDKKCVFRYLHEYEYCKDGHVHLHGVIYYNKGDVKSNVGLLMDIDRELRLVINKALKINTAYKNTYNDVFKRIKKPSHCLQYMKDDKELDRWLIYMYKQYDHSS